MYVYIVLINYNSEPTITSKGKRTRCGEYTESVEMKDCTTCVSCMNMIKCGD